MRNFQFIRHYLIQMFAMRQADILMKHQTVDDSQNTVYTVNGQKDYPAEIFCFNDEPAYQEKKDKSNTHGTQDRKSTRLNSSHRSQSRMPSSA